MCAVCGCGAGATHEAHDHAHHAHDHSHGHAHDHAHDHGHAHNQGHAHDGAGSTAGRLISLERDILEKNNAYAAANRAWLAERGVLALNLLSSPGSGKTSLLVRTIEALKAHYAIAVIEGDQQTSADAERIRATGAPAEQINTGKGCHLDAHMVGHAIEALAPAPDSLLFIENVGNLICPASFDLGEAHKVVILSVTEGEDKPLKYPDMFAAADLVLIGKTDLAPHLDVDLARIEANARRVNPRVKILRLSAKSGEGMAGWIAWIEAARAMSLAGRVTAP